ncbi:hypothetical protein Bca4012_019576 [Brassica carinata]
MALIHWSPSLPHFQPSPNDYGGSQCGGLVPKKNKSMRWSSDKRILECSERVKWRK